MKIACFRYNQGKTPNQFDNTIFSGPWLLWINGYPIYFVGDGSGNITEYSGIVSIFSGTTNTATGTYNINSDGSFTCSLSTENEPVTFSGQLTSEQYGTLNGTYTGELRKVTDLSNCAGSWTGFLYPYSGSAVSISLTVDNNGNISSSAGLSNPVQGKMFGEAGYFSAKMTTGDTSGSYNQISMNGTIVGDSIFGKFDIDAPGNPAGTVSLTK